MKNIEVLYIPEISKEEVAIIQDSFKDFDLSFYKYETKGMIGGSFDTEIKFIIDFFNSDGINAISNIIGIFVPIALSVSKIFKRNMQKIADNNTRPRYTILNFNFGNQVINISNVNENNNINISLVDSDKCVKEQTEYSESVLKEYLSKIK